jgi:3-hydroxyacyl-CoA dehydrogenase/enoyl-CoA hydratase/3-hydroxybutyryl-CoA epimerase
VDRAATAFGMPMGPVELADTLGLDICLSVAGKLGSALPASLAEHVRQRRLGRKSGQGYHRWRGDRPLRGARAAFTAEQQDRLLLRLVNEALACLREGVVNDPDDLDAGLVFGAGFAPFTGGPIHYLQRQGAADLHARLARLASRFGERFAPDPGWIPFTGGSP